MTSVKRTNPLWDMCIVVTMLCSLGFPGNLETLLPGAFSIVFQYGPFLLQIAVMLLSSGDSFMELKIVDLKKQYTPIYLMMVIWFALSVVSTSMMKEQLIACTRFTVTGFFAIWMVEHYDVDRILELTYFAIIGLVFFTAVTLVLIPGKSFSFDAYSIFISVFILPDALFRGKQARILP